VIVDFGDKKISLDIKQKSEFKKYIGEEEEYRQRANKH